LNGFRWGRSRKDSVYLYLGNNLPTDGSFKDLDKLGITPQEGMSLSFYDLDADDQDRLTYLCAQGVLYLKGGRWHAMVDQDSFRSLLRSEVD
jgi:hypothetical protein